MMTTSTVMPESAASAESVSAYPHLFAPLQLRGTRLKSRLVHASMSTRYAVDGLVSQRLIDYHANRAQGGAAMLVTETMNLAPQQLSPHKVFVHREQNRSLLERWATAVRAYDSHLLGQVQDPGRGRHQPGRNHSAIGASALPDDLSWTIPRALSTGEVERLIEGFALGARVLRDAGFAGVEISAGHGHLFHQFLAAASNRRADRFGGDVADRSRILTELIAALRSECGPDFLIGVKLPGEDGMPRGIDHETAVAITGHVHATGEVDYLTWCWGAHSETLDWHLPDMHGPRTPYIDRIATLARAAPGVAIGALGLITDPNEGERILRDGQADLVMLARPLVTDAAWGEKARTGREAAIRYCVSCNTCWGAINAGLKLACDNNPRLGTPDEATWQARPAPHHRRVLVVGGGIAGMEAAWVAAARGHAVTVLSAGAEPGGKTRLHAQLPGGESLSSIYDYQVLRAQRYGVRIEHGVRASLADCLAFDPDAVILATGSTPAWPDFIPEEWRDPGFFPDVRAAVANLLHRRSRESGTAILYDHDHTAFTYATAELLHGLFERVVLVTPRPGLAADEPLVNRQGIYRRLYQKQIDIHVLSEPRIDESLEEGIVHIRNRINGNEVEIEDMALLCHATPRLPDDALAEPLRAHGIKVHLVGDCHIPGTVLMATQAGHRVGEAI
jgi:2,4-dienoyl-CoA reductase-like NADH-dependent reductase (Old Yellow Enzyme family)/thioredoxin reductase